MAAGTLRSETEQPELLSVATNPEHDEERDVGCFAVEPDLHHGAIEDQPGVAEQRAAAPFSLRAWLSGPAAR